MNAQRILIGLGLSVSAVAGYNYIKNLSLTSTHLEVIPSATIHKIDLSGLYIKMDVRLKNPNAGRFKIQYPFIKLIYDGTTMGTSQAMNEQIELPANGEAVINAIMIQIPILNVFSVAYKMYKEIANGKEITIQAQTITTIDLGWKKIPYEKMDAIKIKKAK